MNRWQVPFNSVNASKSSTLTFISLWHHYIACPCNLSNFAAWIAVHIITVRKRSLRRLYFYRCVSVHKGGGLPQCLLEDLLPGRPPTRETPCQGDSPCHGNPPPPRRPPCQVDPPPPGPHPRGKLRGIRSRPTPKGEIEGIRSRPTPKGEIQGDQIQAHTQGGNSGGSGRGQHPRGIRTKPQPPPHDYCCRWYASYWNAFLFQKQKGEKYNSFMEKYFTF